jgi:hypothetical protein
MSPSGCFARQGEQVLPSWSGAGIPFTICNRRWPKRHTPQRNAGAASDHTAVAWQSLSIDDDLQAGCHEIAHWTEVQLGSFLRQMFLRATSWTSLPLLRLVSTMSHCLHIQPTLTHQCGIVRYYNETPTDEDIHTESVPYLTPGHGVRCCLPEDESIDRARIQATLTDQTRNVLSA